MKATKDPTDLLEELRWLSRREEVMSEWGIGSDTQDNIAASELYNIIFDDLIIDEARYTYELGEDQFYYIENISTFLKKASPGSANVSASELFYNPNFIIAQKICELL